jgi:hypothetical protein
MSSELPPPIEPAPIESAAPSTSMMSPSDVNQLAARVGVLESRFSTTSWLYSDNFLKRAFALFGHVFVANLLIAIVLWAVIFACTIIFGISLAGLANR